jgi:acylaminoacyl-peptidase
MNFHLRMAFGLAAVCFFAFPAILPAQDASHKLTAMDEFQFQLATDPQISPDGKKIAYVRRFADPMTDRRYSNLWIINADGTDHRHRVVALENVPAHIDTRSPALDGVVGHGESL